MKWLSVLALRVSLCLVGSGAMVVTASVEPGDQRPCMTRAENRQVKKGMRMARTFVIVDSHGRAAASGGGQRQCVFNLCWTYDFDIAVFYKHRRGACRVLGKPSPDT